MIPDSLGTCVTQSVTLIFPPVIFVQAIVIPSNLVNAKE
jgi:hypothetical protein